MKTFPRLAGVALIGLAMLSADPASAAFASRDIAADSEIVLTEKSEWGSYRDYTIRIHVAGKRATIHAQMDGAPARKAMKLKSVMGLWSTLQSLDVESLTDAVGTPAYPDQSQFTLEYRVRDRTGGFSVYGVDNLSDTRYRDVVRSILKLGDAARKPRAKR